MDAVPPVAGLWQALGPLVAWPEFGDGAGWARGARLPPAVRHFVPRMQVRLHNVYVSLLYPNITPSHT